MKIEKKQTKNTINLPLIIEMTTNNVGLEMIPTKGSRNTRNRGLNWASRLKTFCNLITQTSKIRQR